MLSGTISDPPTYDKMSAEEIDAFLTEMEPEIRTADRDMLEVEALEKKGVTGAGRLLREFFFWLRFSRCKLIFIFFELRL